jgi:hypothetical protein
MARHKLKHKIGETIKLYKQSSTAINVNAESVIRNIKSFFMMIGLLDLATLLKTENQTV